MAQHLARAPCRSLDLQMCRLQATHRALLVVTMLPRHPIAMHRLAVNLRHCALPQNARAL